MGARVLVVDDNDDNRAVYAEFLRFVGFEVDEAENGAQALARIAERAPDVVVMDLAMPGINGFEATRAVKEYDRTSHIKVIVVTALATFVAREMAREAGCDAFLTKPVTPEIVEQQVRKQLAAR
jgi:CheY-like chemotaxis protein